MYTQFFGLSDIPFSIAPNPHYLFMSARHREALSHLTHGLGDTGGFVLLTGEVGTGKTTISRCVLEQLSDDTQVAFILNPTLSCLELLATICDELTVRYKKTGATLKYLTDKIQEKLLKNQKNNVNTILMIDEAQHLQPEVLEQLRLLTNLETDTKKLLQVILIGQPELQQLLQRRDLRQLAQRITARYHLLPLTKVEIEQYINHRLSVADCNRPLFNKRAIAMVHHISQGIPRLINLLCDRALMLAYGNNQSVVTRSIIIQAAEQALGQEYHYSPWWQHTGLRIASLLLVVVVVGAGGFWLGQVDNNERTVATLPDSSLAGEHTLKTLKIDDTPVVNPDVYEQQPIIAAEENAESFAIKASHTLATKGEIISEPLGESLVEEAQQLKTVQQHVISAEPKQPVAFDATKVTGASDALLAKIQSAVEQSNDEVSGDLIDNSEHQQRWETSDVRVLTDMPISFQNAIPRLQFDTHIYASNGEGFVKVNDRERYEGDFISEGLKLVKILPQEVILVYQGEQFKLPALSNW